jgi:hypothetical protein
VYENVSLAIGAFGKRMTECNLEADVSQLWCSQFYALAGSLRRTPQILDSLMAQGKCKPMIVGQQYDRQTEAG